MVLRSQAEYQRGDIVKLGGENHRVTRVIRKRGPMGYNEYEVEPEEKAESD